MNKEETLQRYAVILATLQIGLMGLQSTIDTFQVTGVPIELSFVKEEMARLFCKGLPLVGTARVENALSLLEKGEIVMVVPPTISPVTKKWMMEMVVNFHEEDEFDLI